VKAGEGQADERTEVEKLAPGCTRRTWTHHSMSYQVSLLYYGSLIEAFYYFVQSFFLNFLSPFFFLFCFFETEFHYATQAGLELEILLSRPPQYWDYRCMPPCPA
jgi:hypothetical protein